MLVYNICLPEYLVTVYQIQSFFSLFTFTFYALVVNLFYTKRNLMYNAWNGMGKGKGEWIIDQPFTLCAFAL